MNAGYQYFNFAINGARVAKGMLRLSGPNFSDELLQVRGELTIDPEAMTDHPSLTTGAYVHITAYTEGDEAQIDHEQNFMVVEHKADPNRISFKLQSVGAPETNAFVR